MLLVLNTRKVVVYEVRSIFMKNNFFMLLAFFLLLPISAWSLDSNGNKNVSFTSISMAEGLSLMAKAKDFILLDVRRLDEYEQGHIPNAVLFTNEKINLENATKVLPNKSQAIFVYCRSGRRSKDAVLKLSNLGYTNIFEIGGIIDYKGVLE